LAVHMERGLSRKNFSTANLASHDGAPSQSAPAPCYKVA